MPTPTITPPVEFCFLKSAHEAHIAAGYDFPRLFDYYFTSGYVFKTPAYFMMAGPDATRDDAWTVWWAEAHPLHRGEDLSMIRQLLKCVPYHRPFIGWARARKGNRTVKYWLTDRLVRLSQESPV